MIKGHTEAPGVMHFNILFSIGHTIRLRASGVTGTSRCLHGKDDKHQYSKSYVGKGRFKSPGQRE